MEVFLIERTDKVSWVEDYAMVVVAEDALHAVQIARQSSSDFAIATVNITKVNRDKESVVLVANTGA